MSDYQIPEGANPETCGVTLSNYITYKCRCPKCRDLKSKVLRNQRYGLAPDDYERMCNEQEFRCACCRREAPLFVDHDHDTDEIRGLLCHNCNVGIGHLGDDIAGLEKALDYMRGVYEYDIDKPEDDGQR